MLPDNARTPLDSVVPERSHALAGALVAPVALALLLVARGLGRRSRRAWQAAVVLLAGLTVLHLLHSFEHGVLATAAVLLALVARRRDFDAPGDPAAQPRVLARAALFAALVYGYGSAAIWVNREMADQAYTLGFALRATSEALAGRSPHLAGSFGAWFPLSVLVAGVAALGSLLLAWLAPWRYRLRQEARERALAHSLVDAWGVDTLAPFVLRADKSYFFGEGERAFLAYRVVGGVAIVSGDPVGPPAEFDALVGRFIAFAHERGWRIAVLGASEERLPLYRGHGLHALYHGDEAVLDAAAFSLDGRAIRKVRQSVSRLRKTGYSVELLHPHEVDAGLRVRARGRRTGLARDGAGAGLHDGARRALPARGRGRLFVVGRGPGGEPEGFLHFAVSRAAARFPCRRCRGCGRRRTASTSGSSARRSSGRGTTASQRVSLNFAPFAALLAPEAELSGLQRVERRALLALKGRFQLDNLLAFNSKFLPGWQRRFVVYERRRDLPRVGIAALAAECVPARDGTAASDRRRARARARLGGRRLNWGYVAQHEAAGALPALSVRRPLRSLRSLFGDLRWLAGFLGRHRRLGLLRRRAELAPLSLVQAVSAGGIGLLALLAARRGGAVDARRARRRRARDRGPAPARPLAAGRLPPGARGSALPVRALARRVGPRRRGPRRPLAPVSPPGAGLGVAAGTLYAAGDVATKAAVGGGARPRCSCRPMLAAHGLAFVCLQLAFQRGGALATAGLATLAMNALPIAAGTLLFGEALPAGGAGVVRVSPSPPSWPARRP